MDIEAQKKMITDEVRKATDSSVQALTEMIHSLQTELQNYENSRTLRFDKFEKKISNTVEEMMERKFNGKMTKLEVYMKNTDEHIERVEPMIANYEKNKAAEMYLSDTAKKVGMIAGFIAGLGVIGAAIKFLLK